MPRRNEERLYKPNAGKKDGCVIGCLLLPCILATLFTTAAFGGSGLVIGIIGTFLFYGFLRLVLIALP